MRTTTHRSGRQVETTVEIDVMDETFEIVQQNTRWFDGEFRSVHHWGSWQDDRGFWHSEAITHDQFESFKAAAS